MRLIIVFDNLYQVLHVCRPGTRKYWDVPSTINKSSWPYLLISTCLQATFRLHSTSAKKETMEIWQVRLILVSDHTFQFQHVHRLGLQTIEMCKVRLISVPDHTFQFQHVHRLQIKRYCDVPSMLNKRFWPYLPISTCLQARDKKILRCARYD